MFKSVTSRLRKELSHYRALTVDARRLLLSYYLFLVAYPLFDIFINAFIWRQGNDVRQLVYYNIANCLGILICFFLNGLLLRRFHTLHLYTAGLFLQALSALLVVFSSGSSGFSQWLYGFLAGVGGGFFWANKNYLSLILSRGSNRLYFNSLENSVLLLLKISVPLLAGFIITFGSRVGLYSTAVAYRLLMSLGMLAILVSSYIINRSRIPDVQHEHLFIKKVTGRWQSVRLYNFLYNVIAGAEFIIPTVLILTVLGQEEVLGLVTSATAALSAASLYVLGRKGGIQHVWRTVALGNTLYLLSVIILALFFGPIAVLIYMAGVTIGKSLRFSPAYSVTMDIMERESQDGQYAYICDNEISFNTGRVLGLCLILFFASNSQSLTLRYLPLLLGAVAIFSLVPLRRMIDSLKS